MKQISALIFGVFLPFFLGCVPEREINVPDELIGSWSTSAPKYSDRHFEFTKNRLIFKVGDEETGIHRIKDLEKFVEGNDTWFSITYLSLGAKYDLSFTYDAADDGVISIANQNGVRWTRRRE